MLSVFLSDDVADEVLEAAFSIVVKLALNQKDRHSALQPRVQNVTDSRFRGLFLNQLKEVF